MWSGDPHLDLSGRCNGSHPFEISDNSCININTLKMLNSEKKKVVFFKERKKEKKKSMLRLN